jgi:hypothetical protein
MKDKCEVQVQEANRIYAALAMTANVMPKLRVGLDEERFKKWLKDECKVRVQEANRI